MTFWCNIVIGVIFHWVSVLYYICRWYIVSVFYTVYSITNMSLLCFVYRTGHQSYIVFVVVSSRRYLITLDVGGVMYFRGYIVIGFMLVGTLFYLLHVLV